MKETSILTTLCSLFDKVESKVCPVLPTDTMTVPATFLRIIGAERCADGRLKVTFELNHRYRDTDPTDAVSAMAYLEKLCRAAEQSGAVLRSMSCGGSFDTSAGECSARFEYHSGESLTLMIGERDLSSVLKGIKVEYKGKVKETRYIYGSEVYRRRQDNALRVTLECKSGSASAILNAFGTEESPMTVAVGADAFKSSFVLGEITADGTVRAELFSSGDIEYATLSSGNGGVI